MVAVIHTVHVNPAGIKSYAVLTKNKSSQYNKSAKKQEIKYAHMASCIKTLTNTHSVLSGIFSAFSPRLAECSRD